MLNYFYLILVISLFCLGLRAITDDKMIGYPIRRYFQNNFPYWGKPVVLCSTCMSSFWGTVIFWGYTVNTLEAIDANCYFLWIGACISAAYINSLCWAYYESINLCKT